MNRMSCAIVRMLVLAALTACADTNIVKPSTGTGGRIVFSSNREAGLFQLYEIGADGGGLRRLTSSGSSNELAPVVSPDGEWIAWQREIARPGGSIDAMEIWVMRADGSDARPLVQNGSFNETPSWLPDASGVVYASRVTGNWEIFRADLDGSAPVNLSGHPLADQYPRVSPDGSRIAFHTNRDVNFEIYTMRADGSDQRNVSGDPGEDRFATWTPDGKIVWSRFLTSFDLFLMDGDGASQRPLVSSTFEETHAAVSPDGRWVVYQTDRVPPFTLFVAPVAGGEPRRLLPEDVGAAADIAPMWSAPAP